MAVVKLTPISVLPLNLYKSPKFVMTSILLPTPRNESFRKHLSPCNPNITVTHSMPPEKEEIFKSMEEWAEHNILTQLRPIEKSWQPQDFLPDPCSDGFIDQIKDLRDQASEIPDDYYVCLVGDMITEEALPSYQTTLNKMDAVDDETGASQSPWAIWLKSWTAEENRHGDLLNKYLYLSGRVNMRQIEKTIQYLIGSGMGVSLENNPYHGFVYTSFQERATFIAHGNTARQAKGFGDLKLAKICGTIAADEKRHETAYTKIVEKLFEVDPDTMMLELAKMMRKRITMPGNMMYDGEDHNLFDHFSGVAQRTGVYTAGDYVDILEYFIGRWKVDKVAGGLTGDGRNAQDYICNLALKMRNLLERAQGKPKSSSLVPFSWIFNRQVSCV